ncbi:MAG: DUF4395 domain-containing protein [Anaerolineae bacterium]
MTPRTVDHSIIRTNQTLIITLLVLAYLLNAPLLVGFVALVMIVGTIWPQAGLFRLLYLKVLKPAGIVKPDVRPDNPEPHRFAQGVGSVFTGGGYLALVAGSPVGWVLAGIVVVLAALNLFAGWCAGCSMYYWFNQLGVPGFTRSRIEGGRS